MSFLAGTFLAAMVAAAGPALIHLLNRRRHKTVEWAAMEFLREAVRRDKRILEIRDLLLLIIRTLAVILFVLAMSQPYWVSTASQVYRGEPVHAVLVVDNSLSMSYSQLDKTLLDYAKSKAQAFIRQLPDRSEISIMPLCLAEDWQATEVYSTSEDALEALDRIRVVDRGGYSTEGIAMAKRAVREAGSIPTKRIVFISDMQRRSWGTSDLSKDLATLSSVQLVQVAPAGRTNTWVSDFHLRDGVADAESPAMFLATISHEGEEPRKRVRVSLRVDDVIADERYVDLLPKQNLELVFEHKFTVAGPPGDPLFVPVSVEIAPDALAMDDTRTMVVPVVSRVPVLFVDQYGQTENPRENRYGESFPLRRLLGTSSPSAERDEQLVDIRHRSVDLVTRDDLLDVRMVVVAGVSEPPSGLVRTLREYVEQGGQLFIAAGGEFDPAKWTSQAWLDGAGILPAALKPSFVGELPGAGALDWPTFRLDSESFKDAVFDMPISDHERLELLNSPFFYRAASIDESSLESLAETERARLAGIDAALEQLAQQEVNMLKASESGSLSEEQASQRRQAQIALEALTPTWLVWADQAMSDMRSLTIEQRVARSQPQVLGRYSNGEVFAMRRHIGGGQVLMVTTGVFPEWNSIATDHSVLLFDQLLRSMLGRSLPKRTFEAVPEVTIPIAARDQAGGYTVTRPNAFEQEPVPVEALDHSRLGLVLRSVGERGVYTIERRDIAWRLKLAVNGSAGESELQSITADDLLRDMRDADVRWVGPDEAITLEGTSYAGYNAWKYLMFAVMLCLLAEMIFLVTLTRGKQPSAGAGVS